MKSAATTVGEYLKNLPEGRKEVISQLRNVILKNLPKGFKEEISYDMIGYVVPHSKYPGGYHCDPKLPLPFLAMASQKSFIAVYHMGVYADPKLFKWFTGEYARHSKTKPDMGKSCMRFKKPETIPFELIGELVSKMTPEQWIEIYEKNIKR